jgi:hypothetical protein
MSSWNNVYPHDDCGICMNQYRLQENVSWFPCNHCVCAKCYIQCTLCPICRAPFDRNIKPPIFNKIKELILQIQQNGKPDLMYQLDELRSLI